METGCPIHYHRNSVIGPHPGDKNRRRHQAKALQGDELKIMPPETKVCAARECVWCGNAFKQFMVVCPFCRSCQYCGLASTDLNNCRLCGNAAPDELRYNPPRQSIRVA